MKPRDVFMHFSSDVPAQYGAFAITLYPHIYFRVDIDNVAKYFIKHEFIHIEQIERTNILWFYATYILNWLFNTIIDGHSAYVNITYEQEAFARQMEPFTERDYEILHFNDIYIYD